MPEAKPVFLIENLDFYYGPTKALSNINIEIEPRKVTALSGSKLWGCSCNLRRWIAQSA